ncbi:hypothetical protein LCGC14_1752790 [marine sediment metagenome]|uniref:Uncharacterized protein n=1 Tax=marine sediment metagenome TaxID=412755 RepID=A0A0F9HQQ3_9ZZZZ
MSLLAIGATAVTGWFAAGAGEWVSELCGDLTDDHSSGEVINTLEAETGQTFPQLRTKLQEVVDAWRAFQRAWPWGKDSAKAAYEAKAQEFASALEAQTMATSPVGPLGGVLDQLKAMSPMVWVFMIALLVMTVTLVAFRKPRRR